jgi:hypothetical protein
MNLVATAGQLFSSIKTFFGSARGISRAAIVLGIILRLADYANNRDLWLDEKYLGENVIGRPIFELDRQLTHDQLARPAARSRCARCRSCWRWRPSRTI